MLQSLLQRAREARAAELGDGEGLEEGFTLIELMVVLLIIAILLAIAIPTFLGVTNSASDRAAQSNLTNALTEAKAIYQNATTYSPGGTAYATTTFTSSAPEFSWTTSNCTATPGNCLSEQVVDVGAYNDGNGIILAAYSNKDNTCWFAMDLEAVPTNTSTWGTGTENGTPIITTGHVPTVTVSGTTSALGQAGVYYAKISGSGNCSGTHAANASAFNWGTSYAAPGTGG